jgi:MtN3 and saliva related transmembrane protein
MDADLFGYIAATLTTISFFPQALKTLRSRDTHAISLRMYLLFTSGVAFLVHLRMDGWRWPCVNS